MDPPPESSLSSSDTHINSTSHEEQPGNSSPAEHATFAANWENTDSNSALETAFAPSHLPLSKVLRAWDRRPQSPFSRKKVRFGKVWKRNNNVASASNATGSIFGGGAFDFQLMGQESPARAVKKMRLDEAGTEVVRDWDGRGSPGGRRIVTRSSGHEELTQLPEEDEQAELETTEDAPDEEEASKIEVSYEDGRTEEIEGEGDLVHEDWEDESMTEEDLDGWDRLAELEKMRSEQSANHESVGIEQASADDASEVAPANEQSVQSGELNADATEDAQDTTASELIVAQPAQKPAADAAELQSKPLPKVQAAAIPEGFVSPVKAPRRRTVAEARQTNANRRRTLPVNFAAQSAKSTDASTHAASSSAIEDNAQEQELMDTNDTALEAPMDDLAEKCNAEPTREVSAAEEEWEDVEQDTTDEEHSARSAATPPPMDEDEWIPTVENTPTGSPGPQVEINPTVARLAEQLGSPSRRRDSPIGTVDGSHPRLPLRRSPRRKSSSPLKQSSILPSSEKSHLVAFTPIKLAGLSKEHEDEDELPTSPLPSGATGDQPMGDQDLPQLARSSSAPPEEPEMSPRKPAYPRLSDDTAILQAFLNRAAESKSGKRVSLTAKRESLENRRNSDFVRQAMGSPANKVAPVDVLGDLDPNSPSPRKQTQVVERYETDRTVEVNQDEDELAQDAPSPTKKTSRRSGRSKKKPEVLAATTYSGPTKISVRGSADSVVLKKTEAQEMAQLTRTNTRKNKGASVLPPLRLTRMAKDGSNNSVEDAQEVDSEVERPTKIKWSETLVAFSQDPTEPEVSMLTDELHGPEPTTETSDKPDVDMTGVPTAVPASETPSKPKLRRLKPPRTASTPAKATSSKSTSAVPEPEQQSEPQPEADAETINVKSKPPAANTRKRSRIATPAKPKGGEVAALLPEDVVKEQAPAPKKSAAPPAAAKKSTPAVSKLRAPAPVSTGLSQGKENSLIASPPKKRAKAPSSTAAAPSKPAAQKLDFSKSFNVGSKSAENSKENTMPGIASPAKKGLKPVGFPSNANAKDNDHTGKFDLGPTLGSPAKKRTRTGRQIG